MSQPILQIITASTRPGRVGPAVADWFTPLAREHGGFTIETTDLAELDLPMLNEPHHPRLRDYVHDHTKEWSAIVDRSDAFVLVMPEYNHAFTAPLKNAIDYLHQEWQYKPLGTVSYGGVAGGTRAVQLLKPVLAALKVFAVNEAVVVPFVAQQVEDGVFTGNPVQVSGAHAMLDELARVSGAMLPLRKPPEVA